ncbi:RING finger protein [Elaphomyces granulatus]
MGCSSSQPVDDGPASVSQKITAQPRALRHRNKREAEQRLTDPHSRNNNSDNASSTPQSSSVLQIPVIDVSPELEVIESPPAGTGDTVGNMTNIEPPIESGVRDVGSPPAPPSPSISCFFCIEDISDSDVDPLLRPCGRCHRPCCKNCIRKLFMDACKNESDMPPNCCIPIPIAYASLVLSIEEVRVFKEKYEEWGTPSRIYCPVPTCSAFIPDRLFPVPEEPNPRVGARPVLAQKSSNHTMIPVNSPPTPPSSCPSPTFESTPSIPCPKCGIDICCSCKQLSHPGSSCSEVPDLDPELADLLKRWGIKRCPKCRAAVRRMFGCSHIQCRCGAQWCWFCTAPYDVCRARRCPGEEDGERFERELNDASDRYFENIETEAETQDNNVQRTQATPEPQYLANLDAGWRWDEADEFFGHEPNFYMINPFTCAHSWDYLEESDVDRRVEYECTRCWQKINPRPNGYVYLGVKDLFETGSFREATTDEAESSYEIKGPFILACKRCAVTLCPTCELKTRGQRRARTEWGRPLL